MKFTKVATLIGIISTGFILSTSSVSAGIIYDNGSALQSVISSDLDSSFIRGDDFVLTAPNTTIRSVSWKGWYDGGSTSVTDDFTIKIYSSGALPGALPEENSFNVAGAVNRTAIGAIFGAPLYEYSTNIPEIILTENVSYWVSIFNNTNLDTDTWNWGVVSQSGGNGIQSFNSGASWSSTSGFAFSFQLSDSAVSSVPVPAAVWLMGSALAGLFGFSRKQKLRV